MIARSPHPFSPSFFNAVCAGEMIRDRDGIDRINTLYLHSKENAMIRNNLCLALATAPLLIAACDSPPSGWEQKQTTFNFNGTVTLYDEYRNKLAGTADIVIKLKRASKSTTADQTGSWNLNDIPFGVRDTLAVATDGYDPLEMDFLFYRTDAYPTQFSLGLVRPPSHQVSLISARLHPDGERIEVVGVATKRAVEGSRRVMIFAAESPAVSSHLDSHDYSMPTATDETEDTFVTYITPGYWKQKYGSVQPGDTIHIVAYPSSDYDGAPPRYSNGYLGLGKTKSNVLTFVIP